MKIAIISSSVRTGRNSHRVALFFKNLLSEKSEIKIDLIDLKELNFPLFDERLKFQKSPSAISKEFSDRVRSANGVIIITPEYNGGYPASIKNAVDLLYDEWKRKPVSIVTVSSGNFGGSQVIMSLQFTLWKIGAMTVPAMFPVPKVEELFDEKGNTLDDGSTKKRAGKFLEELFWYIRASSVEK
jgi:NAD(P)H-dependent FMN reductase